MRPDLWFEDVCVCNQITSSIIMNVKHQWHPHGEQCVPRTAFGKPAGGVGTETYPKGGDNEGGRRRAPPEGAQHCPGGSCLCPQGWGWCLAPTRGLLKP